MAGDPSVLKVGSTLALLALAGAGSPAGSQEALVRLGKVTFEPPFVQAGGVQQVSVAVELLDNSTRDRSVTLEQLVPRSQGREDVEELATLRDDGSGADAVAGDGIFAGRVRFHDPVCGLRRLRVSRSGIDGETETSPIFTLPSALRYLATAEFTSLFLLSASQDDSIAIGPGDPGLLLVTIADADPFQGDIDAKVEVRRNGESIVSVVPGDGCIEHRIELDRDGVELDFPTDGAPGEIAVRLDALADRLALSSMRRPSNLTPTLGKIAEAEVTALGVPVPGARVAFRLDAEEESVETIATTDSAGRAVANFPVKLARVHGQFEISATLLNGTQAFSDSYDDDFEDRAPLNVGQSRERLVLRVGEDAQVDLAIRLTIGSSEPHEVELFQEVTPGTGLTLRTELPPGGLTGSGPATYVVRQQLSGLEPGDYDVFTEAVLNGHEAFATSDLPVKVVPEDAGGALVIHRPSSQPGIVEPGDETDVVFKVVVAGTDPKQAPTSFALEEVVGHDSSEIAQLTDDDGDLVYVGSALLFASDSERRQFRVSTTGSDPVIQSPIYTFEFGFLPDRALPPGEISDFHIIEESETGERFAANQLLIKFRDEVSPDRIESIVNQEEASLIGFVPLLDIVQVAIDGESPEEVRRRIASFESYAEVEFAEPNHEVVPAAYPNDRLFRGQAGLASIRALEGWLGAGRAPEEAELRNLAILDTGINLSHPDLAGRVARVGGQTASENCVVTGQLPPTGGGHGTEVAGIAAATINNEETIAGAAFDARFVPIQVLGGDSVASQVACGLDYVIANPDVARIANLSLQTDAQSQTLRDGIEDALLGGVLVVAAAGNGDDGFGGFVLPAYPAAYAEVRGVRDDLPENGLIAVANVDDQGRAFKGNADFDGALFGSRQGPWVDLAAPGVAVPTTSNNGTDTAGTGTSFSAPLVAGAASLLWSRNPGATIEEVEELLKRSAAPFTEGEDQIGDGVLNYGAGVLNGGIEIDPPAADTPAAWPGTGGSACRSETVPSAGNRGFYRARAGRRFLLCAGAAAAGTEKRLRIPPGIDTVTASVRVAGIVVGAANKVRLRAYLVQDDGERILFQRRPNVTSERCGMLSLPEAAVGLKCSSWRLVEAFEADDLPESARIRFEAVPIGGPGPVFLLVDDFRIEGAR